MNTILHNQIIKLYQQGKKYREIVKELNCSSSTVAYHLYEKSRISCKIRNQKNKDKSKEYNKKYLETHGDRGYLSRKITQFHRLGNRDKRSTTLRNFTLDELLTKIGTKPKCYLTGTSIDLTKPSTYSLDHIIPISKNGTNLLSNVGLCASDINRAKSDKTPDEFITLCRQVLEYNGYTVQTAHLLTHNR